ncbi:MAG: acylglycerol kinase family protein [Paludibacteraceae bacterium]|nr:acylglycerol kinase family protein [Paludibacteraceae bacterium]
MKNIAFIINPMAGTQNKRRLPKLINELLDKSQWLENIVFTEHAGQALTLARQYATMGFDAVVAVGGDGTVREVAEGVAGTRSALGIIPMGLTNTLARHLGIPLRGNASITWLNRSEPVQCDCLQVTLDEEKPLIAMTCITAGDTRFINCAQGTKASIQDGEMEVIAPAESTLSTAESQIAFTGQALIDSEEYEVEQNIKVRILPDNMYVLAPKRF